MSALADIDVNAAAVELCLANYLSNSIKCANVNQAERWVEIDATRGDGPSGSPEVVLRVRDNGLGVPVEKRSKLFARFFRAHESLTHVEGTGLGLSIVHETAESFGGRPWAEFPPGASVFAFSLPDRRSGDTTNRVTPG